MDTTFPNAQTQTVIIPANGSVPVYVQGTTITVISTTAAFRASPNDGTASIELDNGLSYVCPDNLEFDMVSFRNETGGAITAKVFIGKGTIIDARLAIGSNAINVQNTQVTPLFTSAAGATMTDVADVNVNAGVTGLVLASNSTNRTVYISNLAANNTIVRVGTSAAGAARGIELPIGATLTLDVTSAIYVYNPKASAISIGVLAVRG